jgi:hypothetical protein
MLLNAALKKGFLGLLMDDALGAWVKFNKVLFIVIKIFKGSKKHFCYLKKGNNFKDEN